METPTAASLPSPPASVLDIARRLERAGFETWCVGGAVRDALLGLTHLDWDLATAATPQQMRSLFRRTVPLGVEFGTVGVLDRDGIMHEVTTFRRDVETDGRHAVVQFGVSLDEDLARRDFTINAIALSPTSGEIRDPFGGRADLARAVVRAVGDPDTRLREDRLRALRAIRFAARFGFAIAPDTWRAIVAAAPHLGRLSMERVKQEIEKTMEQARYPSAAFRMWSESGAMMTLLPALSDVSSRVLAALDLLPLPIAARPQRLINRLTTLVSDLSPSAATRALKTLRFSNTDVKWIAETIERVQALEELIGRALLSGAPPDDATVRRWVARMGRTRVGAVMRVAAARLLAGAPPDHVEALNAALRSLHRRAWRAAFRDAVEIGDLAIDGDDLMAAGVPAGPALGRTLQALLDAVLEDPTRNTPAWLTQRARELNAKSSPT